MLESRGLEYNCLADPIAACGMQLVAVPFVRLNRQSVSDLTTLSEVNLAQEGANRVYLMHTRPLPLSMTEYIVFPDNDEETFMDGTAQ